MFIPRIYFPHPLEIAQKPSVDKNLHHYLMHVIRLKHNEKIILFNGEGGEYVASFHSIGKIAELNIESFQLGQSPSVLHLHLGQAISRGDRMDYAIQKATELGVTQITPLISAHCLVKKEQANKRLQHWQNIAINAAEQCGRTTIPEIFQPTLLKDWIGLPFPGLSLLVDMSGQSIHNLKASESFRFAIGPESGWQKNELEQMIQAGFQAIHLGPRILRTETAPIVAAALLQAKFGDLS